MNERLDYINSKMQEHWNYLQSAGYEVAALFLQGSQNYNADVYTDDYMSDVDTKAIVLPTLEQIVNGDMPLSETYVMPDNSHIDIKDVRVMTEMFEKQNISYLELLFTDFYIINPQYRDFIETLFNMREEIVTMHKNQLLRCIQGMSGNKVKALEHPYPTIVIKKDFQEYGYDKKQLHHIIRLYNFTYRLLDNKENFKDLYTPKGIAADLVNWHKFNNVAVKIARELADYYYKETNTLIKDYIDNNLPDVIVSDTKNKLRTLKTLMIKTALVKELNGHE